jgi:MSHA pilin protein MshC
MRAALFSKRDAGVIGIMETAAGKTHASRLSGTPRGFTLMEFIAVILVAGILAALVLPRLDVGGFRQIGFFQQALAAIRYAQKTAIASNCDVSVSITSTACSLTWSGTGAPAAACPAAGTDIANPAGGTNNFCADSEPEAAPAGDTAFGFDFIGRPVPNSAKNITIGSRSIQVEPETGYTHEI